jgi:hypothetical protein
MGQGEKMITPGKVVAITTAYAAITVSKEDAPPGIPTPMGFVPEDDVVWTWATSAAGANAVTMISGRPLNMLVVPEPDGTVMYAKAASSTNLNVAIGPRGRG